MARNVAVYAPFDPNQGGGVESNLLTWFAAPELRDPGLRLLVLVPRVYSRAYAGLLAGKARTVVWRLFHELRASELALPPARGLALRKALGGSAWLFDLAVAAYRRLRDGRRRSPTAEEVDAALRRHKVAMVHFPSPQVFHTNLPFIYEPWDLAYRHFPEFFSPEERQFRERTYRMGCERASLVVTATRWVKEDIMRQFGIPGDKIAVIRRGSSYAQIPLEPGRVRALFERRGLRPGYILYPAMTFPHKNHAALFDALAEVRRRLDAEVRLVLTGRLVAEHWPVLEEKLVRLGLSECVIQLGHVTEEELTALYRAARFVVFPSLMEGLGLPLLEALAHRVPVLASQEACLPEVLGEAAHYFDARNAASMAHALERGLTDSEWLSATLKAAGRQLELFSASRARETLFACYLKVLGRPLSERQSALLHEALR